ncbi:MAG: serine/threonine protein kinase [Dysgonamonadaceae bacterium]|jgi:serine/threonine-protein kinase|nr:serine/threonine protein kinase [Dysgonamonadaceae bacterium]
MDTFLNDYTCLQELGIGGFAQIFKVRHNELGYIRAIRVLKDTVKDEKSEIYKKFLDECRLLLRLGNGSHTNIVHIYQPRLINNRALVEMDYVHGCDLHRFIEEQNGLVPIGEIKRLLREIGSALAYCHVNVFEFCMDRELDNLPSDPDDGSRVLLDEDKKRSLIEKYKVIHNDIHSGNIMRKHDGSYVLLDFGLAIHKDTIIRSSRREGGAPEYKAPEKWENEAIITEQSDIYSFGIVAYEMLAGRVPFQFNKEKDSHIAYYETGEMHKKTPPPAIEPLRRKAFEEANPGKTYFKDYDDALEAIIMKCLEKNPQDRFANGKELLDAINFIADETPAREENQSETEKLMRLTEIERLENEVSDLKEQIEKQIDSRPVPYRKWKMIGAISSSAAIALLAALLFFNPSRVNEADLQSELDAATAKIEELNKKITLKDASIKILQDKYEKERTKNK